MDVIKRIADGENITTEFKSAETGFLKISLKRFVRS